MTSNVTVDVIARDEASRVFSRVGSSAEHSSGMLRKFGTTLAGVFTGAALYDGARELTSFLVESGKAAAEDQQSQSRLALQLRNSAAATDGQVAATERWITAQGKALGIADDDLRPALARAATATHSVAAAEDQVSLAMNVAAGRGKSLMTVEEALAKARQGNISGLSRLGAVTKDAAGQTLTYAQIVKQLAQTYRGQAATAANTTAGEYQKLQVQVHELEESIGYHLLPVGLELGKWMLGTAVPAAERLGHELADELGPDVQQLGQWLSANRGELEAFAKSAGGATLSTLQTTAHVVGDLVGVFERLPGPLKSVGAELVVGAVFWSKLSPVISATTGAVSMGVAALGRYRTALSSTATQQEVATVAGQKFAAGVRNVAGAAGIALLIDSTQRGNTALGSLEQTAGAAAAGFSAGGPLGAGLATTGALLLDVKRDADDVTDSLTRAQDVLRSGDTDSYAAALSKVNQELNTAKGFDFNDMFGGTVSVGSLLGLIRNGNKLVETQQELRDAMSETGSVADLFGQSVGLTADQLRAGKSAADGMSDSLSDLAGWFSRREAVRSYRADVGELSKALKDGFQPKDAAQIDQVGQSILRAAEAIKSPGQRDTFILNAIGQLNTLANQSGPKAQGAIDQLVAKLRQKALSSPDATKLSVDDKQWQAKVDAALSKVGLLSASKATPTISANDSPFAAIYAGTTSDLARLAALHPTPHVTIDPGNSIQIISDITGRLLNLHDKTIYVRTIEQRSGPGGTGPAQAAGNTTPPPSARGSSAPVRRSGSVVPSGPDIRELIGGALPWDYVTRGLDAQAAALLTSVAGGLSKGSKKLSSVLDKSNATLQAKADAFNAILADYQGIAGGFSGFQSSIFGVSEQQLTRREPNGDTTSYTAPASLQQILGQSASNAASSGQLNSDVQKLLGEGLNKQLLLQLQQAGQAGEANIHTLAMQASLQDIATLNAQQVQTDQNLSAAGTAIADKIDGAALAQAQAQATQASLLTQILGAIQNQDGTTEIRLEGSTIVAAISKTSKNQGRGGGGGIGFGR